MQCKSCFQRCRDDGDRSWARGTRKRSRRIRANAAIELLFGLPILIIMTIACVQFGMFFMNAQLLAVGSRTGALEASQVVSLSGTMTGDPIPAEILHAIDQHLMSSGLTRSYVRLEHNINGMPQVLTDGVASGCTGEPKTVLSSPLPPGHYVRLTISAPLEQMMPNALNAFGIDISGPKKTMASTTIMRYELGTP